MYPPCDNARVIGHRKHSGARRCRYCRHLATAPGPAGSGPSPSSAATVASNAPIVTVNSAAAGTTNGDEVIEVLVKAGLSMSEADSLVVALLDVAEHFVRDSKSRPGTHDICVLLVTAAEALDLSSLIGAFSDLLRKELVKLEVPRPLAIAAATMSGHVLAEAMGSVLPVERVRFALLVLAALVCPDSEKCPVASSWAPLLLRSIVESGAVQQQGGP